MQRKRRRRHNISSLPARNPHSMPFMSCSRTGPWYGPAGHWRFVIHTQAPFCWCLYSCTTCCYANLPKNDALMLLPGVVPLIFERKRVQRYRLPPKRPNISATFFHLFFRKRPKCTLCCPKSKRHMAKTALPRCKTGHLRRHETDFWFFPVFVLVKTVAPPCHSVKLWNWVVKKLSS